MQTACSLEGVEAVPNKIIDLSGLRCPNTVIGTIKALKEMEAGQILQITATDLNAPSNMTAWCRQSCHKLLELYEENGYFIFLIQKQEA